MAVLSGRKVKADLDHIWSYIATESGRVEVADRVIESITNTFLQLSKHPQLGRRRDDLREGSRSVTSGSYVIIYRIDGNNVRILHVMHGRRDIPNVIRH
jgi:toxin ParE1/3/4